MTVVVVVVAEEAGKPRSGVVVGRGKWWEVSDAVSCVMGVGVQ